MFLQCHDFYDSDSYKVDVSSSSDEDSLKLKEDRRRTILEGQREREINAMYRSQFTKHQRVRYYHKPSDCWIDEVHVVAVHNDDNDSKPYYTIQLTIVDSAEPDKVKRIEKQTTYDRLAPVEWEEEKTWAILQLQQKRVTF